MLCLLKFLLFLFVLHRPANIAFARQTLLARASNHSVKAVPNTSAISAVIPANTSSYVVPSTVGVQTHSESVTNVFTTLPVPFSFDSSRDHYPAQYTTNYLDIKSGYCAIGDDFCSFKDGNGTIVKAVATNFSDECLLWDASCSGNRTLAIEKFFDVAFSESANDYYKNGDLLSNDYFQQDDEAVNQSDCNTYNPPGRMEEFSKIRNWMRSSQCKSAANEWVAMGGDESKLGFLAQDAGPGYKGTSEALITCCGGCEIDATTVDLYYWPELDANLSCLSIVGESVRPLDYGATTSIIPERYSDVTITYWGCESTSTVYTTAEITTIGSLTVKMSLMSPWSSSPCVDDDAGSQGMNHSIKVREEYPSVYARSHPLTAPSSVTQENGLPVSTLVSGDFTFTSPSIYANFYSLVAADDCGASTVSSTMLSFSTGELSSIVGGIGDNFDPFHSVLTTRQFDFKDLPCPPQSVMEENWYKPQPGEPYRPLIAMPSQLKEKIPWYSYCQGALFTAFDPPSALKVATALAPPLPPSEPTSHPWAPAPSPTIDPGAGHAGGAEASTPVPASIPTVDQPEATNSVAPNPPKQEGSNPQPQPGNPATQKSSQAQPNKVEPGSNDEEGNDPQQTSDPHQGSSPEQGSGSSEDSGQEANSKPNSASSQVGSNQGSSQNPESVPQNDPKQADASPFNGFIEGQVQTINNQVFQPLSDGISIAGTTLTPGAPPITVSGTPIHLEVSALVVGISTVPLTPEIPTPMITTIAGQAITAVASAIAIAGNTLNPGAPGTTIDGTILSLNSAGQFVVGSKTIPFGSKVLETMTTSIAGQVITAAPNAVIVLGTTLNPGAPGITLDGTLLSLNTASELIVGSKTVPFESAPPNSIVTTIGGQVITAAPNRIAIGGTTLTPGASGAIVGGTLISLNTAGQLIVGSKTIALLNGSTGFEPPSEVTDPITTPIDGQVITAGPTALEMAGTTLTPGAPGFTIDGTLVSLNTAAELVIGSKTIPLESENGVSSGQTAGLGGLIIGGFGNGGPFGTTSPSPAQGNVSGGGGNSTNTSVQAFQGNAASLRGHFLRNSMAVSAIAMCILMSLC